MTGRGPVDFTDGFYWLTGDEKRLVFDALVSVNDGGWAFTDHEEPAATAAVLAERILGPPNLRVVLDETAIRDITARLTEWDDTESEDITEPDTPPQTTPQPETQDSRQ